MKTPVGIRILGCIVAVSALALALGAGPPAPPSPLPNPADTSDQAAPMPGHHEDSAAAATHDAEMKAECQAMMVKKEEMQEKLRAMDATMDKLVAAMNAAAGSKNVDAMEAPMAAVINELVSQRKASRAMMMETQTAMMAHMMKHMQMHGSMDAMECPMMQADAPRGASSEEKKHMM